MWVLKVLNSSFLVTTFAILIGLALAACVGADTDSEASLGSQFQIGLNESVSVKPGDIVLKLLDVPEDSRCPVDVVCIWAGKATTIVNVTKDGRDLGEFELALIPSNNEEATVIFDGHTITLIRLDPKPRSTEPIDLSDYIATFLVDKAQ